MTRPSPLLVPCVGLCGAGIEVYSLPSRPSEILDGGRNPGGWSTMTLRDGAIGVACPKCTPAPVRVVPVVVELALPADDQAAP